MLERPDELGGTAVVRLRVPHGAAADRVRPPLRARRRAAQRRGVRRRGDGDRRRGGAPSSRVANPVTRYRWLLAGGEAGYAWVNALGHDRARGRRRRRLRAHRRGPGARLAPRRRSSTRSSRTASPPPGSAVSRPDWAVPRAWDELPTGRGRTTPFELVRRRPAAGSSSTSTTSRRSARTRST